MTNSSGVVVGLLLAGAVSLLSPSQASADMPTTVTLASCSTSTVTGLIGSFPGGVPIRQFLGIPYAAPPVGPKRWQPPETFCWNGTTKLTNIFGSQCPQNGVGDENCLFLNVFTPVADYSNSPGLPVMVWIHGGGMTTGAGHFGTDPTNLVKQGVIVVTINYRLGALGFLAHKALDKVATKNTGNYGIQDQQAALKWVKANIKKFGGNPANVTLFGQSAGAMSIQVQLVSPGSVGLFHKAIIQSAAGGSPTPLVTAEGTGAIFAKNSGCPSTGAAAATCLRKLTVTKILANQSVLGQSTPLVKLDNVVIKGPITGDKFRKMPIIMGSTHDEQRFHLVGNTRYGFGTPCNFISTIGPGNYIQMLQSSGYPMNFANIVAAQYPAGGTPLSANIAFTAQQSDRNFVCPARRNINAFKKAGGNIYAFEFNEQNSPTTFLIGPMKTSDNKPFPLGAFHGADQQFLFPAVGAACGAYAGLNTAQKKLAAAMVTYWTTFAKTGNPNPLPKPPGAPLAWPPYTANVATAKVMSLAGTLRTITATAFNTDHKCSSFWDSNS